MLDPRMAVNCLTWNKKQLFGQDGSTTLTTEVKWPLHELHRYQDNSGAVPYCQWEKPMTVHTCGKYKTSSVKVTQKNIQRKWLPTQACFFSLLVCRLDCLVTGYYHKVWSSDSLNLTQVTHCFPHAHMYISLLGYLVPHQWCRNCSDRSGFGRYTF